MIAAVSARGDSEATRLVERLERAVSGRVSHTVASGVAIAAWQGPEFPAPTSFHGDYAYVGHLASLGRPGSSAELRGGFASVARDGSKLVLARGRFGGRPLFVARVGTATVACSRLLPLANLLRGRLRLNELHLVGLIDSITGILFRPLPFHDVECVPPNTQVEVDALGRRTSRRGEVHLGEELRLSDGELASRLREEFRAALDRQTRGLRRIGVMCSGGVDSSYLLTCAVLNERERGGPTVVPAALDYGGEGDDRPYLRALCANLKVEPVRVAAAAGATYAGRDRVVDAVGHSIAPATTMLALADGAKAEGAEALLSGENSELLLDSDPDVYADFLLHQPAQALARAARFHGICETRVQSVRRLLLAPLAQRLIPDAVKRGARLVRRRPAPPAWMGARLTSLLDDCRQTIRQREIPPARGQRARVERLAGSELLAECVEHTVRWETAMGIRIVLPFLDDDFVTWVGRVPSEAIFAGGWERGLLRQSMPETVPDCIRFRRDKARPVQGFCELFRAMGGFESVRDLVDVRELAALNLVNADAFRREFESFARAPEAAPRAWVKLWGVITAEAHARWFREFNNGLPANDSAPVLAEQPC